MIEGPSLLGSEYVKPWIQLPIDSEESSRIRVGMPFSFRAGHTRHTRKRLTTVMASRGRVYDPKRPTTPAAATENSRTIFARPYATARYARYSLFRAARIDPSVIWKHVWDVVRGTLNPTRAANPSLAAGSRLTPRTAADNATPTMEERVPPTTRTRHMRARGRSTRAMNRTSPLSRPRIPIDVANEARFTRDPAIPTADEVKRCAARAQKAKPKIEFEMLPANTQPPCSRTNSASDIGSVETFGVIQGNSQPSMTPTNSGSDSEAIRISRDLLRASAAVTSSTGIDDMMSRSPQKNPHRFRACCFIREKEFFSDMEPISKTRGAHSTGVPKSINTLRKFSQCAGDPDSELWSPASAPERTRLPWRRAPAIRVRVTSAPSWRNLSWIYGSTASAPWRRRFSSSWSRSSARVCSPTTSRGQRSLRKERCESWPQATSISSSSS